MVSTTARLPVWLRNRWGVAVISAILYLAVYTAWTLLHLQDPHPVDLIQDMAFLPLGLFAALAAWRRVATNLTLSRYLRRAWFFLGLSCLALFLGDFTYLLIEEVWALPVEQYHYFDYFYLAFYPLVVVGLMLLPVAPLSAEGRWRFLVDLGVVTTTATMVIWYFVIAPLAEVNETRNWVTQVLVTAFPIGDLVALAGITALLLRRPESATRSALWFFSLGLLGFIGFDLLNALDSLSNRDPNSWSHILWLVAYFFFALAALRQPYLQSAPLSEKWSEQVSQFISTALPFAAVAVGYGVVIYAALRPHMEERLAQLIFGAALLTALLIGRQMLTVRENRRLTRELLALSADLEKRVQKRARELQHSHAALLASQNLASVGALAAAVINQLSQPLNTILTAGEVLEAQAENAVPDTDVLREYVAVINRAAAQGAQVMHILRAHARNAEPRLAPQRLEQIAQDALLLSGYTPKGWEPVRLTVDVPDDLPSVICDRHQMAQVLIALLKNAREAMPTGGLLTVRARRAEAGLALEVRDTGVGLTVEARERIFDPLYSTKAGNGLGLSVVSAIVRAHRGTVEAVSDGPGQGAAFVVTLPLSLD